VVTISQFVPNTTVAIFRDGTIPDGEDTWGEPVPATTPPIDQADARDLPALLTEYGQNGSSSDSPTAGEETTIHRYRLRLRPGAVPFEITPRDRVLDRRGRYFTIDTDPAELADLVQRDDLRLVLRRLS